MGRGWRVAVENGLFTLARKMETISVLASHAGVFRGAPSEGWKTSSPKKACLGGYIRTGKSTSVKTAVVFTPRGRFVHYEGITSIIIYYTLWISWYVSDKTWVGY